MELVEHCSARGDGLAAPPARPLTGTARIIVALDRAIYRVAKRWLFAVNSVFFATVALIFLTPVLVAAGQAGAARPIYGVAGLFCHQHPDRSFFVLGEKMACCHHCAAIYGAIFLFGLLFAALSGRVRRPRAHELALLALPVVVDGGGQLAGLWTSAAGTRVVSGTLLGVAICWLLLPWLEQGFAGIRLQIERLFARLVAEGRARPLA